MPQPAVAAPPKVDLLAEYEPQEIADLLDALRQAKAEKADKAAAVLRAKETGYPKPLYNAKFPGESVLSPDGLNRLSFYRGKIEVYNATDEAWIKQSCPGRVHEADMPSERECKVCGFRTASSDCYEVHMNDHLA